jgi:hypothetical protein
MVIVNFLNVHTPVSGGRYLMKKFILVLAGLALSGIAMAGPSWTYADLGYRQGSTSALSDGDQDAIVLSGSFGFADKYHVGFTYFDGSTSTNEGLIGDVNSVISNNNALGAQISDGDDDVDIDGFEIVVGVNPAVTDNTDFVFDVFYFDIDTDSLKFTADIGFGPGESVQLRSTNSDGYGTRVGLRSMYTDKVELSANIEWRDISNDDLRFTSQSGSLTANVEDSTQVSVNVGGQYFFTDAISLNVNANLNDDNTTAQFGGRWSF